MLIALKQFNLLLFCTNSRGLTHVKIVQIIIHPAKLAQTQQWRRTNKVVGRCFCVRAGSFDNLFFHQVFQVAEDKTTGLLQVPCRLGMNIFCNWTIATWSTSNIQNANIQNAKIHRAYYQISNKCLIFIFGWSTI